MTILEDIRKFAREPEDDVFVSTKRSPAHNNCVIRYDHEGKPRDGSEAVEIRPAERNMRLAKENRYEFQIRNAFRDDLAARCHHLGKSRTGSIGTSK